MGKLEIYKGRRYPLQRTQWRWRIRAANGRIVATGAEGYNNLVDLANGVRIARNTLVQSSPDTAEVTSKPAS